MATSTFNLGFAMGLEKRGNLAAKLLPKLLALLKSKAAREVGGRLATGVGSAALSTGIQHSTAAGNLPDRRWYESNTPWVAFTQGALMGPRFIAKHPLLGTLGTAGPGISSGLTYRLFGSGGAKDGASLVRQLAEARGNKEEFTRVLAAKVVDEAKTKFGDLYRTELEQPIRATIRDTALGVGAGGIGAGLGWAAASLLGNKAYPDPLTAKVDRSDPASYDEYAKQKLKQQERRAMLKSVLAGFGAVAGTAAYTQLLSRWMPRIGQRFVNPGR